MGLLFQQKICCTANLKVFLNSFRVVFFYLLDGIYMRLWYENQKKLIGLHIFCWCLQFWTKIGITFDCIILSTLHILLGFKNMSRCMFLFWHHRLTCPRCCTVAPTVSDPICSVKFHVFRWLKHSERTVISDIHFSQCQITIDVNNNRSVIYTLVITRRASVLWSKKCTLLQLKCKVSWSVTVPEC